MFYITNADGASRGGHRHHRAWQALVCIQGRVDIQIETYESDDAKRCLNPIR